MANIELYKARMEHADGTKAFYPHTSTDIVFDSTGKSVDTLLSNIYNGTKQVGDSAMLGGKPSSEYATKEDLENIEISGGSGLPEVYVGDDEPTDDNIVLWVDTNEDDDYIEYGVFADDSNKLGGKPADEYATKEDLEGITITGGGADTVFVGTRAELDTLSDTEKEAIEVFVCTDDSDVEDDSYALQSEVNDIKDGTTQVGDSAKLGGKSADSFYNLGVPERSVTSGALIDYIDLGTYGISSANVKNITDLPKNIVINGGGVTVLNEYLHASTLLKQTIFQNSTPFAKWERVVNPTTKEVVNDWQRVAYTDNISNPNLLINGDFRVNQRDGYYAPKGINCYSDTTCTTLSGQLSADYKANYYSEGVMRISAGNGFYVKTSDCVKGYVGAGYTVGMWKSSNAYGVVTVNDDNTITFSASGGTAYMQQYIEKPETLLSRTLTLSVEDVDGNTYSKTFTMPSTFPTSATSQGFMYVNDNVIVALSINTSRSIFLIQVADGYSITLKYVKLELGNVATPLSPRSYGEELALSDRYYLPKTKYVFPLVLSSGALYGEVTTPVPMRIKPTLVSYNIKSIRGEDTELTSSITSISVDSINGNQIMLALSGSSLSGSNKTYVATIELEFSAEL